MRASSGNSICFATPVKSIYHYLPWSLACTLAEPMIQGISVRLWELYMLHSYLGVPACPVPHTLPVPHMLPTKRGRWRITMFKERGKRLKNIITYWDILEEFLASLLCFHVHLVLKSSVPISPLPESCLWALSPPELAAWWEVTATTRHPSLLQVLSCCCKTSLYTSGACLPCREVRITRFAPVKEKGAKPTDLLLMSPWHWNQAFGSVMPFLLLGFTRKGYRTTSSPCTAKLCHRGRLELPS